MENELIRKLIKEEKSRKIFSKVFDNSTIQTLHFLANKGIFDKIEFVIKTGKEAYVFRAVDKSGNYKAVKIYKLEASDFKNMKDYIEGDIRFRGQKNTKRGIVFVWTQKEYKNLSVYKKAGVNVPLPIAFKNNVLVMEFIGEEGVASKSLKEKKTSNIEKFHRDILENMAKMVYKCKIVHADLSEYNILNKDDDFVIIDAGQGVPLTHPLAKEFLERDVKNIANYLKKHGFEITKEELLSEIKAKKQEFS